MTFFERAFKYITRQWGKSLLLGTIFLLAFLISISGLIILRATSESIDQVAAQSNAHITLSSDSSFENQISVSDFRLLESVGNIREKSRGNFTTLLWKDIPGFDGIEGFEGIEFPLRGIDNHNLEGPFYFQNLRLIAGDLNLSQNQIAVFHDLGWELGDVINFIGPKGESVDLIIAALYETTAAGERENTQVIFATPDLVNELQGIEQYNYLLFFVEDPAKIQQTMTEIQTHLLETGHHLSYNNLTYLNLRSPMDAMENLVQLMLLFTIGASAIVISLLLGLWVKERRRETALLMSLGISKPHLLAQRFLETAMIFGGAFITMLALSWMLIPIAESFISNLFEFSNVGMVRSVDVGLTIRGKDLIQVFSAGLGMTQSAVFLSTIPLLSAHPRHILTTID